jgi:hypothetical protein
VGGSAPNPGGPSSSAGGGGSRRLSRYWSFLVALAFTADALGTIFSMSLAAAPAPPLRRPGPGAGAASSAGAFLLPESGRAAGYRGSPCQKRGTQHVAVNARKKDYYSGRYSRRHDQIVAGTTHHHHCFLERNDNASMLQCFWFNIAFSLVDSFQWSRDWHECCTSLARREPAAGQARAVSVLAKNSSCYVSKLALKNKTKVLDPTERAERST